MSRFLRAVCALSMLSLSSCLHSCEEPTSTATGGAGLQSRVFLVLLDMSKSYTDYEPARLGLLAAVNNLGLRDRLVVARITGRIDPKDFALLEIRPQKIPPEMLRPTKNLAEWRSRQRELDGAWQRLAAGVRTVSAGLEQLKGMNRGTQTDLHGALTYAVDWLDRETADEKTLVVCSDLEHDTGRATFAPPAVSVNANQLHVQLLFVTYKDRRHSQSMEAAWRQYFSSAADFKLLDSGSSPSATIITSSGAPRRLPSPFETGSRS